MKKGTIILGSSNSHGETRRLADYVSGRTGFPVVDLKAKNIAPFDYEFGNRDDDFLPLIREIAGQYELLVFATPVYWYSMSGILKNFFDRISDLLKIEKETGRKLRGKQMAVISCGSDNELKAGFYMPFEESARYLGMNYLSGVHGWLEAGEIPGAVQERLEEFIGTIA